LRKVFEEAIVAALQPPEISDTRIEMPFINKVKKYVLNCKFV